MKNFINLNSLKERMWEKKEEEKMRNLQII